MRRDFSDFGPPRRVQGGLRARSTRGSIGTSWWSRRFVEVLESFALGTRMTRGRSYARSGQVLRLDVAPGVVAAEVQGSRPQPYPVRIGLPAFDARVWARLEGVLAAQAFYSARLLAGDLPAELADVFAAEGAPLFPSDVDEMSMRCGCPDPAVPCKHLAATFYLLAEALDADPFLLLRWRGRDRDELLARLRAARSAGAGARSAGAEPGSGSAGAGTGSRSAGAETGSETAAGGAGATGPEAGAGPGGPGAATALSGLAENPLDEAVERFWVAPVPLPARPTAVRADVDLLLRQLDVPARDLGGPGLLARLRPAYQRFAEPPDGPPPSDEPD
ncbi:hypothetical protein ACFFWC_11235 [Plantactinospora siamensis]|uniref:SWIM-type domain-containing protein n=1 Tax=Plantactinospora siamensis TaxID=555372 RepID=A0ABV6P273_9ACTN